MTESALLMWAFGLLAAAGLLVFVEVMLPSGGLIALVSAGLAVSSIVCFWRVSMTWGLSSVLAVLVLAPVSVGFALKVWPYTPLGRRMILGGMKEPGEDAGRLLNRQQAQERSALMGARGVAMTDLRPVGSVQIEGERVEALAEGGLIEAGSQIRVTAVEGNKISVRAVV